MNLNQERIKGEKISRLITCGKGVNRDALSSPVVNIPFLAFLDPRAVLQILSNGDDRRSFLGLKFSIPGFSWVGKFDKYFLGGLI